MRQGIGKGLEKIAGLPATPPPPLPLGENAPAGDQSPENRRRFQDEPVLRRRGIRQEPFGDSYDETRAARNVQGSLAERIVVKELRRRRETFEFRGDAQNGGQGIPVAGWHVDFLITSRNPPIALDVYSDEHPASYFTRDFLKAAALEGQGYPYEELHDQTDILASVAVFERAMDRVLGRVGIFGGSQV